MVHMKQHLQQQNICQVHRQYMKYPLLQTFGLLNIQCMLLVHAHLVMCLLDKSLHYKYIYNWDMPHQYHPCILNWIPVALKKMHTA